MPRCIEAMTAQGLQAARATTAGPDPIGTARPHAPAPAAPGLVGPNAITRMDEALAALRGPILRDRVFAAAGLSHLVRTPPTAMVDEGDVAGLHRALRAVLGPAEGQRISAEAGQLTGDYLLAHRIPRPARALLRALPRPLAARLLVRAIARHAWTFAGSGSFSFRFAPSLELTIAGSPVCRLVDDGEMACAYSAATFERVFGAILGPRVQVTETACAAAGDPDCRFLVTW
ncbi:bacteriochlorophyll 4-vinyl reductase [Prosthecomicrobium sp. N25]|uniref:bacteriochlorophyll 4-vinyl reductase n=1 Tax=Prosthecomicrobium sp. N25 TaxID=3129254 RepID=UPI003077EB7E